MPISHKYKLIFIHIPKCAGMSIWKTLEIVPQVENLIDFSLPSLQHLLPKQIKDTYVNENIWTTYKKFTVIRNPYDRVISDYFWMKDNSDASRLITDNFDDFLALREDVVKGNRYDQDLYFDHFYPISFYFEDVEFDHVIRFENIENEFGEMAKLYGIKNPLVKVNESNRQEFMLSLEQQERIYNLYENDFLKFGYDRSFKNSESILTDNGKINGGDFIKEIKVQVYSANEDFVFSEGNSISKTLLLNGSRHLEFTINSELSIPKYLRFDIGDAEGFLIVNNICIKNNKGELLWKLNLGDLVGKKNILLIESQEYFQDSLIHLSTNNDPQFIVRLTDNIAKYLSSEIVIHVELSPLDEGGLELLTSGIIKPLSFLAVEEIDFRISSLEIENRKLKEDVEVSNTCIFNLNTQIAQLNKDNDSDILKLKSQIIQLNRENDSKDGAVVELKNSNDLLANELSEKNKNIARLNKDIDNVNKEKSTMSSSINKYKDLVSSKSNDNSELLIQIKDYQTQLGMIKIDLNKKIESGIHDNKIIGNLKETINMLEEAYEKKNLIQIAYARVLGKKVLK